MDIAAAKDGLRMTVEMERTVKAAGYEDRIEKWEALSALLPDYRFDETGALCEWAMKEYQENNKHRHISHLYAAWPAFETQDDPALAAACNQAIENRNRENEGADDTASHGWVHKALVAARLKKAWSTGSIKGLRARTNAQVDLQWTANSVTVTVTSDKAQTIKVGVFGGEATNAEFEKGETKTFTFAR